MANSIIMRMFVRDICENILSDLNIKNCFCECRLNMTRALINHDHLKSSAFLDCAIQVLTHCHMTGGDINNYIDKTSASYNIIYEFGTGINTIVGVNHRMSAAILFMNNRFYVIYYNDPGFEVLFNLMSLTNKMPAITLKLVYETARYKIYVEMHDVKIAFSFKSVIIFKMLHRIGVNISIKNNCKEIIFNEPFDITPCNDCEDWHNIKQDKFV